MVRYLVFFVLASVAGILLQLAGCSSDGGSGSDAAAADSTVDAATDEGEGGAADAAGDIAELDDACPGPLDGPENTLATCSDGYDNDGDKHIDCQDFECMKSSNPAIVAYCKNDPKVVECGGLEEKDTVDLDVGTPGCTGLCALLSDQAKEWSSPTTYLKCLPADTCPADRPNLFKLEGDNGCASCFDACWAKWITRINGVHFTDLDDSCGWDCEFVAKIYGLATDFSDKFPAYKGYEKAWNFETNKNPRLTTGSKLALSVRTCGKEGVYANIEFYEEETKEQYKIEVWASQLPDTQQTKLKKVMTLDGIVGQPFEYVSNLY